MLVHFLPACFHRGNCSAPKRETSKIVERLECYSFLAVKQISVKYRRLRARRTTLRSTASTALNEPMTTTSSTRARYCCYRSTKQAAEPLLRSSLEEADRRIADERGELAVIVQHAYTLAALRLQPVIRGALARIKIPDKLREELSTVSLKPHFTAPQSTR